MLLAAALKLYGFGVDPVARTGVFSAPAFQFFVIAFEISLGGWLVSGKLPSGAWLTALTTFLIFAAVSFYQGWLGQASCGCLGSKVSVNPWLMFVIDLTALAALIIGRPDLTPIWNHRAAIVRTGVYLFGAYFLFMGALAGFAHYRHGSIGAALASMRNERLTVYPATVDMGSGDAGESKDAAVEITNRTEHPIRLIGGTADCSCIVLGDLPVTIPPGETRSITVTVRLPRSPGIFTRKAELAIDDGDFKKVSFRITGRIVSSAEKNQD